MILIRFAFFFFLQSLSGHTSSIESVTFDSAEVLVLAGAYSGTVKLWDLEEGKSECLCAKFTEIAQLRVKTESYSFELAIPRPCRAEIHD